MVDLNLYKIFYAVAKTESLTKAADELFLSQPAVSQAVKKLENQLGGKLFNRVNRGMELTEPGGRQMFEAVDRAMKMLSSAEQSFKGNVGADSGVLRISAADTVVTHFLMRYIKKFHELYPNVTIMFKDCTTQETLERIKSGKADIGMVNLPIYDEEVLLTGQTGLIEDIFVASDTFANLYDKTIELKSVTNYPILMLDNTTSTSKEIFSFLASHNINITPEFEVASVELIIEMAKNGMGIACVPRRYILEELARGELKEIKVVPALPFRATGVVINKDVSLHTPAVKEFLKILNVDQYNQSHK